MRGRSLLRPGGAGGLGRLVVCGAASGGVGRLMGIVTVDEDTGAPISPARSIIRSMCHGLDILPVFAGYARPVTHVRRQTWADSISRTVVVQRSLINAIDE